MRTTRNRTQQQLADLLGVNKSAIGQIEGKANCSTTTIQKWAEALDFEWEVAVRQYRTVITADGTGIIIKGERNWKHWIEENEYVTDF